MSASAAFRSRSARHPTRSCRTEGRPMSASNDEITFSGEPLDRSPWAAAPIPPGPPQMPVPGGYPSHMPVPDGYPSHMPVPQNLPPTAVSDGSLQAHDAGSLDWLTKLRAQIFLAHRAALLAQHALLEAATGPGVGAGVTGPAAAGAHLPAAARARPLDDPRRSADGGGTPAGLALDEQVPIAALLDGLLQDEIIAGRPARCLLEATLIFRGELPLEGQTVRWETGVDQVVGAVETFHATCHTDGQPVLELTGGRAGPAEAAGGHAGPPTCSAPATGRRAVIPPSGCPAGGSGLLTGSTISTPVAAAAAWARSARSAMSKPQPRRRSR